MVMIILKSIWSPWFHGQPLTFRQRIKCLMSLLFSVNTMDKVGALWILFSVIVLPRIGLRYFAIPVASKFTCIIRLHASYMRFWLRYYLKRGYDQDRVTQNILCPADMTLLYRDMVCGTCSKDVLDLIGWAPKI